MRGKANTCNGYIVMPTTCYFSHFVFCYRVFLVELVSHREQLKIDGLERGTVSHFYRQAERLKFCELSHVET
jgi:hypothetical protein